MRLLLDTHIVVSIVNERTADLTATLRGVLADPESEFYVSIASLWEIAIKQRLGKLKLSGDLELLPQILTSGGLKLLPINEHHALATVRNGRSRAHFAFVGNPAGRSLTFCNSDLGSPPANGTMKYAIAVTSLQSP
jgi:PIN domain nuclease of toxin-antitoxin system